MIALLLGGCVQAFDGSYLVDLVVDDSDDDNGIYDGEHYQYTANILSAADGTTIVSVAGLELLGAITGRSLAAESSFSESASSGGCTAEVEQTLLLTGSFSSYDRFSGAWSDEVNFRYDGCGASDESSDWGASAVGRRIFDGPQVDDNFDP
jgi:hypothetical protein